MSTYSNIYGSKQHCYWAMPRAEETLANLSPDSALSFKAPALPSKPLRNTLALVGKAYFVAGQATTLCPSCRHTRLTY